jgi:hypothetical protein
LDEIQYDLSPNLSPRRREALILTPTTLVGNRSFSEELGVRLSAVYFTQLRTTIIA